MFPVTESGLPVAGEEIGDGTAGFGLDDIVDVDEAPAEPMGDERADRGFAGAHKAGQDDAERESGRAHGRMDVDVQADLPDCDRAFQISIGKCSDRLAVVSRGP